MDGGDALTSVTPVAACVTCSVAVCLPLQARQEALRLSSSECALKRELHDARHAGQQTAALSAALVADKTHLSQQLQEVRLPGSKVNPQPHSLTLAVCVCVLTD